MGVKIKEESGAVLIASLVLLVILLLLGTTLTTITLINRKKSYNDSLRLEAYYLAYSGATLVAEWMENTLKSLPPEQAKTEIMKIVSTSDEPVSAEHETADGSFEVWVTHAKEDNRNLYTIYAEGTIKNMTQNYSVQVVSLPPPNPNDDDFYDIFLPYLPSDFKEGTDLSDGLGWVKSNNGHVVSDKICEEERPVKFDAGISVEHQEKSDASSLTQFKAPVLFFQHPLKSFRVKGPLTMHLAADIIVFLGDVELDISGNNIGTIQFHTDKELGKVYFYGDVYGLYENKKNVILRAGDGVAFYFRDGCKIKGNMTEIPSCLSPLPSGVDIIHGQ